MKLIETSLDAMSEQAMTTGKLKRNRPVPPLNSRKGR
jgi:hypothetical protein